jgi:hypothetical protein
LSWENLALVLNKRLLDWDKKYNIITDAQFGIRAGHSTIDAIFALQTLINTTLKKRGGRLRLPQSI